MGSLIRPGFRRPSCGFRMHGVLEGADALDFHFHKISGLDGANAGRGACGDEVPFKEGEVFGQE